MMVHEALGMVRCVWLEHTCFAHNRVNVIQLNELSEFLTTHFALFNLIYRFNGTGKQNEYTMSNCHKYNKLLPFFDSAHGMNNVWLVFGLFHLIKF